MMVTTTYRIVSANPMISRILPAAGSVSLNRLLGLQQFVRRKARMALPEKREQASLGATPYKHNLDGVQDDQEIYAHGRILDVIQVVAQLFLGVFDRTSILVKNLSPSGDTRTNGVSQVVVRNLLLQRGDKLRPLGTRTHKT